MTEERDTEQAGAPIDETGASETEVQAAVERAIDPVATEPAVVAIPAEDAAGASEIIALQEEPPVVTDMEMPSAAAVAAPIVAVEAPAAQPAESIQIATDHPMAGFYVQTPLPPEVRGNRGAGVLIALIATIGFAVVYAGVIAAWIAPVFPPSTFLSEGMLPYVSSWGFIFAVVAFFVGMSLLVLIFGRAGWWAYVLGGFFVGVLVWAAATVGFTLSRDTFNIVITGMEPLEIVNLVGLSMPTIFAAIVAREVSVWFGAWIGSRGRKMKAKNAEALASYEARIAEPQAV